MVFNQKPEGIANENDTQAYIREPTLSPKVNIHVQENKKKITIPIVVHPMK